MTTSRYILTIFRYRDNQKKWVKEFKGVDSGEGQGIGSEGTVALHLKPFHTIHIVYI